MSRYTAVVFAIAGTMLLMFAAVELLRPAPLVDPRPLLGGGGPAIAMLAVALLSFDAGCRSLRA